MIMIETPASMDVVTWPPVLHGSTEETNKLTQRLLHDCLDHHEGCSLHDPSEEFNLPSRVLFIEDDITCSNISVRLVENHGLSSRYIALSYCWGSKDKQPLRTTRENFAAHLVSIPWDSLPPLFRDIIILTRDLDIKYLWIDSLCIIQDDIQDWLNEASKMALVYRQATLVIAAADSEDSTQQLSRAQRPEPITFCIPYFTKEGYHCGSYNVAAKFTSHSAALDGPLRKRGWAFQEWYLSRRKVFFTSQGLYWNCDIYAVNERGVDIDLGLYETMSWQSCLSQYSGKHLTYSSDRITALLGIVHQIRESRGGLFVSKFGVWEDQLIEQVLWRPVETRDEDDLLDLPSWSWAATGGRKLWQFWSGLDEAKAVVAAKIVLLADSASLSASGVLIRTTTTPLLACCTDYYYGKATIGSFEDTLLPGFAGKTDKRERFLVLDASDTSQCFGLAIFDREAYQSGCFCFPLASQHRLVEDPWYGITPLAEEHLSPIGYVVLI